MARPPKKRPISVTVYEGRDANDRPTGVWHAFVPIKDAHGNVVKDKNGRTRRKHFEAKTRQACEDKVRAYEDEQAEIIARHAATGGQPEATIMRLHAWLRYWLAEIIAPTVEYNTLKDYTLVIERDITPYLDDCDLPDLTAAAIDLMLTRLRKIKIKRTGRTSTDKPLRAYIRLRMALIAAERRPKETGLWHNPIYAVRRPVHTPPRAKPFTLAQTKLILEAAARRRNKARWRVGWALGHRPGEVQAMMRDDFWLVNALSGLRVPDELWADGDTVELREQIRAGEIVGALRTDESMYRRKWQHGCDDPHECGARYHRYPCPRTGAKHARYHRNGCPQVKRYCKPNCAGHAVQCPHRHGGIGSDGERLPGGQVRKVPKSEAGIRTLYLNAPMTLEMLDHLREQDKERMAADDRWIGSGALFTSVRGGLLNERDDWGEFQEILADADLSPQRPYDGRHMAATMLLAKKIDSRYVMEALGWSTAAMLKRYQHVIDEMRRVAPEALGDLFYGDDSAVDATSPDCATDLATGGKSDKVVHIKSRRRKAA